MAAWTTRYQRMAATIHMPTEKVRKALQREALRVNSVKCDHLIVDDHRPVTFKALVSESYIFPQDSRIQMRFMVNTPSDLEHIHVDYSVKKENVSSSNGEKYFMIELNAHLPLLRTVQNRPMAILYFYCLEKPSSDDPTRTINVEEDLQIEKGAIRCFSFQFEELVREGNKKIIIDTHNENIIKMDGLVTFNRNIQSTLMQKHIDANQMMQKDSVEILVPVSDMMPKGMIDPCMHSRLIDSFFHAFACFSQSNSICFFKEHLESKFQVMLNGIACQKHIEDWDHLVSLTMLLLSQAFELRLMDNKNWLNCLFSLQQASSHAYMRSLSSYFVADHERELMNQALERYLKNNENIVIVNAVAVYFFINKRADSSAIRALKFSGNLYYVSLEEIKPFLDSYLDLMNSDDDFCALFLHVFAFNTPSMVINHLLETEKLPRRAFVHYLTRLVSSQLFIKETKFVNRLVQLYVDKIVNHMRSRSDSVIKMLTPKTEIDVDVEHIGSSESEVADENKSHIGSPESDEAAKVKAQISENIELLKELVVLLCELISFVPQETDLIIKIIQLNVTYAQIIKIHATYLTHDDSEECKRQVLESFGKIIEAIKIWLKKEFSQSLLISFGLDKCNQNQQAGARVEDMQSRKRRLENDEHGVRELNPAETSRSVISNRLGNMPEIFAQLWNIEFTHEKEFQLYDQDMTENAFQRDIGYAFKELLESRAQDYLGLRQLIQVRAEMNLAARFGDAHNQLLEYMNRLICTRLSTSNDAEFLCQCLKNSRSLLSNLVERLVGAALSKREEIEFMLSWKPLVALLKCHLNSPADSRLFTPDRYTQLLSFFEKFIQSVNCVTSGEEKIRVTEIFACRSKTATELIELAPIILPASQCLSTPANFSSLIKARENEIQEFRSLYSFLQLCSQSQKVDVDVYGEQLKTLEQMKDVTELTIANVCAPLAATQCARMTSYTPSVTCFNPPVESVLMSEIRKIWLYVRSCAIISDYFSNACDCVLSKLETSKGHAPHRLDLAIAVNDVWPLALENLHSLALEIKYGSISFTKLEKMLAQLFDNELNQMTYELLALNQRFQIENSSLVEFKNYLWNNTVIRFDPENIRYLDDNKADENWKVMVRALAIAQRLVNLRSARSAFAKLGVGETELLAKMARVTKFSYAEFKEVLPRVALSGVKRREFDIISINQKFYERLTTIKSDQDKSDERAAITFFLGVLIAHEFGHVVVQLSKRPVPETSQETPSTPKIPETTKGLSGPEYVITPPDLKEAGEFVERQLFFNKTVGIVLDPRKVADEKAKKKNEPIAQDWSNEIPVVGVALDSCNHQEYPCSKCSRELKSLQKCEIQGHTPKKKCKCTREKRYTFMNMNFVKNVAHNIHRMTDSDLENSRAIETNENVPSNLWVYSMGRDDEDNNTEPQEERKNSPTVGTVDTNRYLVLKGCATHFFPCQCIFFN